MSFLQLLHKVGSNLGLKTDELARSLPSGNETVLANRLRWALAYLERNGALKESRGRYRPAGSAREAAPAPPARPCPAAAGAGQGESNPAAVMVSSAGILHEQLRRGLLARIHAEPPEFFERLVIELLLAMGYGCRRDLVGHLGRRGDGGIDGAVPQDVLGLDVIYIQAKRYRPSVSVPVSAVREFAGSLDACKASKGVFVTTAAITTSAWKFVSAVPSRIVLIDGSALVDLLIGHNIGVRVRQTYEIKEIDEGYLAAALHHRAGS